MKRKIKAIALCPASRVPIAVGTGAGQSIRLACFGVSCEWRIRMRNRC